MGNYCYAIELILDRLKKENKNIYREKLFSELSSIVKEYDFTQEEKKIVLVRLKKLTIDDTKYKKIIRTLEKKKTVSLNELDFGTAYFPVVAKDVGLLRRVSVSASPGKGQLEVINPPSKIKDTITSAVSSAQIALREFLKTRWLKNIGEKYFNTYDFSVQIETINESFEGKSIGLAVSIAFLSYLLKKRVPQNAAFTGFVDIHQEIQRIGNTREKVTISKLKGIKKLYLPLKNQKNVCKKDRNICIFKHHLGEILTELFDKNAISKFCNDLNKGFLKEEIVSFKKEDTVLLSWVGANDPHGKKRGAKEHTITEGAVLTLFRRILPDAVWLFATKKTKDAFTPTEENAKKCVSILNKINPETDINLKIMNIKDPTNHENIFFELGTRLQKLIKDYKKDVHFIINLTSGTCQMHTIWFSLLKSISPLKNAQLLQVRHPRAIKTGEERIEEVKWRLV